MRPALAGRITGIVFWGLVVVGLAITGYLLQESEQRLEARYQSLADRTSFHR
ncbi:hypothetical protein [Candidatus Reidiella endopervernicosa]|uniref:Uncharacterized protein n=1 Tax=Candidatus Reidiella endopervernicosa TaxID=2738883 RepID=A0A6N0HZ19_9GAMM|nr:hypothetical protein [Candidatus Reidiella endopervernicosa]QKQ27537.1 hypothetical protein HUE57_15525 [Candidatus Reidiella endopervernicosa]